MASVTPTGYAYTDGVLSGVKWGVNNLTFSAPADPAFYGTNYGSGEAVSGFDFLNEQQKTAMRASVRDFSLPGRLVFQEVVESHTVHGTIRYAESSLPSTAWGYFPSTADVGGDTWYNNARYAGPLKGNYPWFTFQHETGHATGLKHPHTNSATFGIIPLDRDSIEYSIMSYRSYVGSGTGGLTVGYCSYPQSLMMYDISAQQHMYGANFDTNAGDSVYQWSSTTGEMFINGVGQGAPCGNIVFLTVWDGGGRDTFNLSNYAGGVKVDLRPENWSTFAASQIAQLGNGKTAPGNVANPRMFQNNPASLIEDVIGGAGADQIMGNDANNTFTGGAGNDSLDGGLGSNTARYSGLSTEYLWQPDGSGGWTISDRRPNSPEGTDSLMNIQWLAFANGTVEISAPVAVNRAPAAQADSYAVDQDTTLNIAANVGVLANDSDPDGDRLSAMLVTNAGKGSLSLRADGSFDYRPIAGYVGTDTFTYRASDGALQSGTVTVTINVEEVVVNLPPVAVGESFTMNQGTALNVAAPGVLANDSDPNEDNLTVVMVSGPANGTFSMNQNGSFSYQPNATFSGQDSFTYKVTDGQFNSAAVTATIQVVKVNRVPVATGESYSVNEGAVLSVAAPGVLANDADADGDALTAALVTNAGQGSVTMFANGGFTYTPNSGYSGPDSFTYRVSDGTQNSNVATVAIQVLKVNKVPVATGESYSVKSGTALNVVAPGLLANDSDPDQDAISAVLASGPANGTLSLNANGSFTYTPRAGFMGQDSFTYRVSDGKATSGTATATIQVLNQVPVANGESYNASAGIPLNVAAPGLLANDTDGDGDALKAVLASQPSKGTVVLSQNGSFTYTANAGASGADSFTYRVTDGTSESGLATVTIQVALGNRAPVAVNDQFVAQRNKTLNVAARGVLINDSDPDGDAVTAQLVTAPAVGNLKLRPDGSFSYQPKKNFTGVVTFTYRVSDGKTVSNTATVSIDVKYQNRAPKGAADTYTLASGGNALERDTLRVEAGQGVLANDSDPDGDKLTAVLTSKPGRGTLSFNPDGSFVYNRPPLRTGAVTFEYRVFDGKLKSSRVKVTIKLK